MKTDQSSDTKRKSERRQSRRQAPIQTQITKAEADLADAERDQRNQSEERSQTGRACERSQRRESMKPVSAVPLARAAPARTHTDSKETRRRSPYAPCRLRDKRRRAHAPTSTRAGGTRNNSPDAERNHGLDRPPLYSFQARPGNAGRHKKVGTPRTRRELSPRRRRQKIWTQRAALRPNLWSAGRGSSHLHLGKRSRCERAWFRRARCLAEEP